MELTDSHISRPFVPIANQRYGKWGLPVATDCENASIDENLFSSMSSAHAEAKTLAASAFLALTGSIAGCGEDGRGFRISEHPSIIAWTFVPPNQNELTHAYLRPSFPFHVELSFGRTKFQSRTDSSEKSCAGTVPFETQRAALMRPAIQDAHAVCPMFAFTAPIDIDAARETPYARLRASISIASPILVAVPCVSTNSTSSGSIPESSIARRIADS